MTVLVTGATGFLGGHVVDVLHERGERVLEELISSRAARARTKYRSFTRGTSRHTTFTWTANALLTLDGHQFREG